MRTSLIGSIAATAVALRSCMALLVLSCLFASSAAAIEISSTGRLRLENDNQNPPVPDKNNKVVGFCAGHSAIAGVGVTTTESGRYDDVSTGPPTLLANMNAAALAPFTITTAAGAFAGKEAIQRKYPLQRHLNVRSESKSVPSGSTAMGVGAFRSAANDKRATLSVIARVVPVAPETGTGAGSADDPFTVLPGTYTEAPVLDSLRLVVESTNPSARADLAFETSTSLDATPLWSLKLRVNGDGSRQITFSSAARLGLNDALVTSNLTAALDTSNPRDIRLLPQYFTDGYTLFEASLTSAGAFSYEFGGTASAQGDAMVTSVQDENASDLRLLVRNPAVGKVDISWGPSMGSVSLINIFDAFGRRIRTMRGPFTSAGGRGSAIWSAEDDSGRPVPNGAYFVQVAGTQRQATERVMLIK